MNDADYGKAWGLRRLATPDGLFTMVATDQRPPIMDMIRARTGAEPSFDQVAEVKRMLVTALAPEASALLIDPIWGYPPSFTALCPDRGLIITLEDHAYEDTPGGRRSRVIDGWSAARIRAIGADAVKLLAWYRPDASPDILAHQQQLVAEVGAACRAAAIPFVFELLTYPLGAATGQGTSYATDPNTRPALVLDSVRAFASPAYGIDLWKLESPLPPAAISDPDGPAAAQTQAVFDALGQATPGPWVMLSGGADRQRFLWILTYALRAGACGFLAGRSIWADAIVAYPDTDAAMAALRSGAIARLAELRELTTRLARPLAIGAAYARSRP